MSYTVNIVLRTDKKDSLGRCPIALRITKDRRHTYKSLGEKALPEHWDNKNRRVTKKAFNHSLINALITNAENEARKKILEEGLRNGAITQATIKRATKCDIDSDLNKYIQSWIKHLEQHGLRSPETIRHMKGDFGKWFYYTSGAINFTEVTVKYLEEFQSFLRNKGLAQNTVWRVLKFLRAAFNAARKDGVTNHYPFQHFRLVYEDKLKSWLDYDEVEAIYDTTKNNDMSPAYKLIAYYFVLGCHTGLRFGDLQRVYTGELVKGNKFVCATLKTGEPVSIPLTDKIKELLKQIGDCPLICNGHANNALKEIATSAKIKNPKAIHFHLARHTFATLSLELGIPITTVQNILGHRNVRTTSIYAKVSNKQVKDAMDLWDKKDKEYQERQRA